MLTPSQQERYARHLLLDEFGGEGQERLLAGAVRVEGTGPAALWAARYLAASGVGRLAIDEPSWRDELRSLGPWLTFTDAAAGRIAPRDGATPAESAMNGAQAALDIVRQIARDAPK
ncbi:MAG: hypothetical protein ABR567_09040 [Myxococcales bacterium]